MRAAVLGCLVSLSLSFAGPAGAAVGLVFETITVSNSHMGTVKSRMVLQPNHRYRITVSGTVSDWCPASAASSQECGHGSPLAIGTGVDALYCYATWRCPTPVLFRQLWVNGKGLDQLAGRPGRVPYSRRHVYSVEVTRLSGRLSLVSASAAGHSTTDNSGAFSVELVDLGVDPR